jgi:cation diffusion facilitator family transporter
MEARATAIIKTLLVCLAGGVFSSLLKIYYGRKSGSLAFFADGIHSLFDAAATLVGIISIGISSKPPDEDHPYGHRKFETVSALSLGFLQLLAAYEVGNMAYERLSAPVPPEYSLWGVVVLVATMLLSFLMARLESGAAHNFSSHYLASDALHNQSDIGITAAVLASIFAARFQLAYLDALASIFIVFYLMYVSARLIFLNLRPLVDHSVLDPKLVEEIAGSIEGVIHCHHVRSRGEMGHHFLDLNLHLPGDITLEKAHEIAHNVESRLKEAFPGLVDVVIHTEPHGHEPCKKDEQS